MDQLVLIGKNISRLRKVRKLTQEDLAGLPEMDRSYLSEIENGYKNLSVTALLSLAKALDVHVTALLEGVV
jgi:HTH-type transcriptional regulator, competence development regulator